MRILGVSDGMNGGVALIEDGRLRYVVQEERLTRKKMATGFPRESISRVLEDTGIRPSEIDAVAVATINEFFREPAVAYDGWLMREQTRLKELMLNVSSVVTRVGGAPPLLKRGYYEIKTLLGGSRRRVIKQRLREDWGFTCPIEFINHHFAHACSAYFTSGFDDATVITKDGAGDNHCSHVYEVRGGRFRRLWQVDSFDSVGNYYAYVTHLCGFKAQKHEGKITGLAAYGEPTYLDVLRKFVAYRDGSTANTGQVFYWAAVKALQKALPNPFSKEDLAASVQKLLEEVCCAYVSHWVERTGCRNVALAGGVFANVKLNQYVHELEHVDSVFIHPGMGDEGLAVGAALALAAQHNAGSGPELRSAALDDVYFGPGFGEKQIAEEIERQGLEAEYVADMESRIAGLLAQGRVVARFDGRLEYGPRALGNRSVLYQPTDPTVNDWLNKKLRRTEFMPFAPVTLEGYADQCYEGMDGARYPAQFMTITFDCTKWMKENCPAVVHVDGTARPQTINERTNPSYYRIVDEYRKLTGLPSIINTSFNMHEEPIVCTPYDAIRGFIDGGLDYLAMGHFLLENKGSDRRTGN
jgi:carbamoyltransferase